MGRLLGPSEYGVLTAIISLLFISAAIAGTIQTTVTKYSSIYFSSENIGKIKILFYSITKRILFITFFILIIILIFRQNIASFLNLDSVLPIIFLGIMIVIHGLTAIGRGVLQGAKQFKDLGINIVLEVLFKLGIGVVLIIVGLKASGAVFGFLLATLFSYILIFLPIRKILRKEQTDNNKIEIKKFYKEISFIMVSTILISLFSYLDINLVKHFFSSYETGQYSAVVQIGRIILFISGAISIVVFPRMSEKFIRNENTKSTILKSFGIVFLISIILLIIYYFFPEFIIKMMYGDEYTPVAYLIFRYGIFMLLISLINLQIYYFISVGKFWYLIFLFFSVIGQLTIINFFHNSLEIVIWILVINATIVFLFNNLLIFAFNKRKKNVLK